MAVRSINRDRVRQRAEEERDTGGSSYLKVPESMKVIQLKPGTMNLDIVPYEVRTFNHLDSVDKGDLWYRKKFYTHRGIGVENKTVVCPTSNGQRCPICEYITNAKKRGNSDDEELKTIKKKERALYNVDVPKDGVQLMEISTFCFEQPLQEEVREGREEWADFANLEGGFTLQVRWKEEAMGNNKFLNASRIDFRERSNYSEKILDESADLDGCLIIYDYETLEKMFFGVDDHDKGSRGDRDSRGGREDRNEKSSDRSGRDRDDERESGRDRGRDRDSGRERGSERGSSRGGEKERDRGEDNERGGRGSEREERGGRGSDREERGGRTRSQDTGGRGRASAKEEEEKSEPTSSRRRPAAAKEEPKEEPKSKGGNDCPDGGIWAEDCDKLDACAKCPEDTWEACRQAADDLAASNSGKGSRR